MECNHNNVKNGVHIETSSPLSRRSALYSLGGFLPLLHAPFHKVRLTFISPKKYHLGACDWSLGYHSDPEALREAKRIGLDGVQVSLGKLENNMHLRQKDVQEQYKRMARETGMKISSLAIGELNQYPYKSDPQTIPWVRDSIQVAKAMKCKVVLLAFFGKGDLKNDPEGQKEVIRRLKEVAPLAEKSGVILGIESWLSAEEHMAIIDGVGSDAVRVYYDVANSEKMGYEIYKEIKWLGDQICEVHMKENGFLLGEGKVDFNRVKESLESIRYKGWMQIEGGVPPAIDRKVSNQKNASFLRKTFEI